MKEVKETLITAAGVVLMPVVILAVLFNIVWVNVFNKEPVGK